MSYELYHSPVGPSLDWLKEQIFTGPDNAVSIEHGGVVPKVNDTVTTWIGSGRFVERVTKVDPVSHLSTLEPVNYVDSDGGPIMIGADPAAAELLTMANLYLNPTNNNFPVGVDVRLPLTGVDLSYAKLFLGTNISNTGIVISVRRDAGGNVIDDQLGLTKVVSSDPDDHRYEIREGNVDRLLKQDSVVTLVLYNTTGGACRYRHLVVKHNHLTANLNANASYIKDLELDDAWVDPQDPTRLLVPQSMLESSFSPTIRKVWQNKSREVIPETDPNLSIVGWGDWALPKAGTKFQIVVKYKLKPGERSVVVDPHLGTHISKIYDAVIVDRGTGVSYQLFVIPEWESELVGYVLKAYMYSSDYNMRKDVTEHVSFTTFNGLAWGSKQTVNYSLSLDDIPEIASNDIVSGSTILTVVAAPVQASAAFLMYTHKDDVTPYGNGLKVVLRPQVGYYNLDISCGITQEANWLEEMYYKLNPYYDALTAEKAPEPTHVDVLIDGNLLTYRLDEWQTLKLYDDDLPVNGALADVSFYILTANNERLELACTKLYTEIV